MTRIIVTDLTRFKDEQNVCTAGIDMNSGQCIRPMPYLSFADCQRLKILPGAILSGIFKPSLQISGPHQEDMNYSKLKFEGPCTSTEFMAALEFGLFANVEEGFEIVFHANQKHIPLDHVVSRSIITIQVEPGDIKVIEDEYNAGRIKVHVVDGSGKSFRYLPITDLGFYRHAQKHHEADDLDSLNSFINGQENIYLRIGLSRNWYKRPGYWMQVNGIYTFPAFHHEIRSYE